VYLKRRCWLILPVLLMLWACGPSLPRPESAPGAPVPQAAVERFLQLVEEKDYVQLGWVFGTKEGPIIERDPIAEVERRMYALASILEHERYAVQSQAPVPGTVGEAFRFQVGLVKRGREYVVPFTVVRGPEGRWFVEQIGVEEITEME
jgi:hypothetical protein